MKFALDHGKICDCDRPARIAEYRRHAADCRKRALETKFLDLKRQWEDLARQYDEFAEGRAARKIARGLDYLSNPVNDAERLRHDPAMRWIVGGKATFHLHPRGQFAPEG